ncbi:MAG: hypothetical protein JSU05_04890 [Bacteroidetes bacterium]|nr:hypothetical protein [Bacteroidota bacterium]
MEHTISISIQNNCYRSVILVCVFSAVSIVCIAQTNPDSLLHKVDPSKYAQIVNQKASKIEDKLVKKSMKTLDNMQHQETKIYKRLLSTKDSLQAKAQLAAINDKYSNLRNKLKNPTVLNKAKKYIPGLDSMTTTLKFLNGFNTNQINSSVSNALAKTELLQDKFQQADEIKKFINQRRQELQQQLQSLGMLRQLKQVNKQAYYYNEQVKEYKAVLSDKKRREKKAIDLLSKTKVYKDFIRRNSLLASLFRLPQQPGDPAPIFASAGLQTRSQVNGLIQQRIAAGGPNAMQQFQQNLQSAQSQMSQLKSQLLKSGGGSSDDIMPQGFKPNTQTTKSFLKRLEFGTNFQSQKSSSYFPVTTDIGLSVGYKLNDKSMIGIGASYKLGLGHGWNDMHMSSEGVGLRSYIDWKLKGNFYVTGGYEQNYKTAFTSIQQLKDYSAWQQSALIGLSKSVSTSSKLFKKTKLQLLFDVLSYQQVPRTQPVIFRIGYSLN